MQTENSNKFLQNKQSLKLYHILLLFHSFILMVSNLAAVKTSKIFSYNIPPGIFFFSIIYAINTCIAEVYGFRATIRMVWLSVIASMLSSLLLYIAVLIPGAPDIEVNQYYDKIFSEYMIIVYSGMLALILSSYSSVYIISKTKLMFFGRFLIIRYLFSSLVAIIIDSSFFYHLVFLAKPAEINWKTTFYFVIIEFIYQVMLVPLVSLIVFILKNMDNIDHYDYNTKFGLF